MPGFFLVYINGMGTFAPTTLAGPSRGFLSETSGRPSPTERNGRAHPCKASGFHLSAKKQSPFRETVIFMY